MVYLLVQQGFFTPEQQVRFADALIAILVAVPAVFSAITLCLQVRNNKTTEETHAVAQSNGAKLNAINKRTGVRATDEGNVVPGEMRELQAERVDSSRDGEIQHAERRRNAAPEPMRPTTAFERDDDDANQHRGAL